MSKVMWRCILGVLLVALPGARLSPAADHGLWVEEATWRDTARTNRLITEAAAAGFTLLLVEVPLADDGPRGGNRPQPPHPLVAFIDAAHARGIQVHGWVQATRVVEAGALPASPSHPVRAHPDWVMVPRALATELARLDPHNPAYLGTLDRWARDHPEEVAGLHLSPLVPDAAVLQASRLSALLQRVPFDGIQLDSASLPSSDFDYGALAVSLFRDDVVATLTEIERNQLDARAVIDPRTYPDAFPLQWSRFRRSRVTSLVARLGSVARSARPGIQLSVMVAADPDEALGRHLQDWRTWMEVGFIDTVCLAPSTVSPEEFQRHLVDARQVWGTAAIWAGVAAHLLAPGETFERIRTASRVAIDGLMIWSYATVTDATRQPPDHLQQIGLALRTGAPR